MWWTVSFPPAEDRWYRIQWPNTSIFSFSFSGALEARKIPAGEGLLSSAVNGEIELDGKVMVIKRIHVTYHLKLKPEQRETAVKVHGFHADYCPVARTIKGCVEITTELNMEDV
jgi:uncharacterized OsmC-like protein